MTQKRDGCESAGIRGGANLLQMSAGLPRRQRRPGLLAMARFSPSAAPPAPPPPPRPSRGAAGRRLRIDGVVEDAGEGVVDVAHHVVQLVLSLQAERVGGFVRVDHHLHGQQRRRVRRRPRRRAAEAGKELYLVLRVGVHGADLQEVEGDLHLETAESMFSSWLHARDRRRVGEYNRNQ